MVRLKYHNKYAHEVQFSFLDLRVKWFSKCEGSDYFTNNNRIEIETITCIIYIC